MDRNELVKLTRQEVEKALRDIALESSVRSRHTPGTLVDTSENQNVPGTNSIAIFTGKIGESSEPLTKKLKQTGSIVNKNGRDIFGSGAKMERQSLDGTGHENVNVPEIGVEPRIGFDSWSLNGSGKGLPDWLNGRTFKTTENNPTNDVPESGKIELNYFNPIKDSTNAKEIIQQISSENNAASDLIGLKNPPEVNFENENENHKNFKWSDNDFDKFLNKLDPDRLSATDKLLFDLAKPDKLEHPTELKIDPYNNFLNGFNPTTGKLIFQPQYNNPVDDVLSILMKANQKDNGKMDGTKNPNREMKNRQWWEKVSRYPTYWNQQIIEIENNAENQHDIVIQLPEKLTKESWNPEIDGTSAKVPNGNFEGFRPFDRETFPENTGPSKIDVLGHVNGLKVKPNNSLGKNDILKMFELGTKVALAILSETPAQVKPSEIEKVSKMPISSQTTTPDANSIDEGEINSPVENNQTSRKVVNNIDDISRPLDPDQDSENKEKKFNIENGNVKEANSSQVSTSDKSIDEDELCSCSEIEKLRLMVEELKQKITTFEMRLTPIRRVENASIPINEKSLIVSETSSPPQETPTTKLETTTEKHENTTTTTTKIPTIQSTTAIQSTSPTTVTTTRQTTKLQALKATQRPTTRHVTKPRIITRRPPPPPPPRKPPPPPPHNPPPPPPQNPPQNQHSMRKRKKRKHRGLLAEIIHEKKKFWRHLLSDEPLNDEPAKVQSSPLSPFMLNDEIDDEGVTIETTTSVDEYYDDTTTIQPTTLS